MFISLVDLYRALGGDWMGGTSTASQSDEYVPTTQVSSATPVVLSDETASTTARYTTREVKPKGYDPEAEWSERQERSRERVSMALHDDEVVNEVSSL